MFSNAIEESLKSLTTNNVTDLFIISIIILFLLSALWTKMGKLHSFTNYSPNLLTSVGILGTFTGIVIGLLDFDPTDIDGSITLLLEGLKVAFITSLIGIFASILFKILLTTNILTSKKGEDTQDEDIGVEDLYSVMKMQNENIIKLQKSLNDNDESSLVGQIKLLRSDFSDNHKILNSNVESVLDPLSTLVKNSNSRQEEFTKFADTLWIKLQDFADMLSKSATEQVINALKEVISDFNNKLTEQFGENFKLLNESVEKLVIWQDNYKDQLGEMKDQFDTSVTSMSEMEKSIDSISTNASSIPDSMNNLEKVITVNQHQVDELSRHLDAFKDIRDRAVEAIPEIKTHIDTTISGIHDASLQLISGITESTDKISNVIVESAEEFTAKSMKTNEALVQSSDTLTASSNEIKEILDAAVKDTTTHFQIMIQELMDNSKNINNKFKETGTTLLTEFTNSNKNIQSGISDLTSDLQKNIQNLAEEQVRQARKVFDGLDTSIDKALQNTADSVKGQVDMIDKVAEKEIANVMNSMGKALASISNQFTTDYQKLVKEMQSITSSHR